MIQVERQFKGMVYKLKVSRSSFRMHMRNRKFTNTPKINIHELNRTSSSRPVCATSLPIAIGSPEKELCLSDYRYPVHIIEIPNKVVNGIGVEKSFHG